MTLNWLVEEIPLTTSIDGNSIDLELYQLVSPQPGPQLYLQSGVHGAELQGHLVLIELLKQLPALLTAGSVRCIPFANPLGLNQKIGESTSGRYDPISRENWNRNYLEIPSKSTEDYWDWKEVLQSVRAPEQGWQDRYKECCLKVLSDKLEQDRQNYKLSLANKLAYTLQLEAIQADYVLDLHTGPRATRYIYACESMKEKSLDLGFPFSIVIPHEFDGAMDEAVFMPWVHLKAKLEENGIEVEIPVESYTLELGDEETVSTMGALQDLRGILHFMVARGMVPEECFMEWHRSTFGADYKPQDFKKSQASALDDFRAYRCPASGLAEYLVQPGDKVESGQGLFQIYEAKKGMEVRPRVIQAKQRGIIINICSSSAVREGMRLIDVLENPHEMNK